MTDEELKALVAQNSLAIREMRASREESEKQRQQMRDEFHTFREESEKRWQDSDRRWQQLREESDRRWQESQRRWDETREELIASRQETDRLITSFNQQLGRLGNRLGDYTESLFRPSLERAMREQFGMKAIFSPFRFQNNGDHLEIDMVAHGGDEVYLTEIKSRLRQDGIDQILDDLRKFPRFFPEHRGKKLFGILAALDIPADLRAQVVKKGLYLATIKDDVFEIVAPDDFTPRAFGLREA